MIKFFKLIGAISILLFIFTAECAALYACARVFMFVGVPSWVSWIGALGVLKQTTNTK